MIQKYVEGLVYVFVDASNIYFSQLKLGWRIDFKKLMEYFKNNTQKSKIYYYIAYDEDYFKQRKFIDFLENKKSL